MNNPESLRFQLIEAMKHRLGDKLAESIFQHDIWPVLEAAMKAGELLVSRNTQPQIIVADAIEIWMQQAITACTNAEMDHDTISKAKLLRLIGQINTGASAALRDARRIRESLTGYNPTRKAT